MKLLSKEWTELNNMIFIVIIKGMEFGLQKMKKKER